MARGQFIMEFMILLAVAILLGATYLVFTNELFSSTSEHQRLVALDDIGYMIQDEIMLAESVEDGYERTITISQLADRFAYSLTNTETALTLSSGTLSVTYTLPAITGQLQKGRNVLQKRGNITVMPG